MNKNTENGNDIFISEFFDLENELNDAGVFDAIINSDSNIFLRIDHIQDKVHF